MQLILGIILLFAPVLLVFVCKNKLVGLAYAMILGISIQTIIALVTQALGIFTYPVVITLHILLLLIAGHTLLRKKISLPTFSWVHLIPIVAFGLLFHQLWSIHYSYSGIANSEVGLIQVGNSNYSYPIFSDEWITAGLAQYSIDTGSLPLKNPLTPNAPYANLLTVFTASVSHFFLVTGLDPITNFAIAAIISGWLLCVAVYLFARANGSSIQAAAISTFVVSILTQSGNLPGIWFLLSFVTGLICVLLALAALSWNEQLLASVAGALAMLFYPPMFVFLVPLFVYLYARRDKQAFKNNAPFYLVICTVCIIVLGLILFRFQNDSKILKNITMGIFHKNLDRGIVAYHFWNVVPVASLPFILYGLWETTVRRKWHILIPLIVGVGYWFLYSFYQHVVFIEFPRIVMITSVLFVACSAVGIDALVTKGSSIPHFEKILSAGILIFFGVIANMYPLNNKWPTFTLHQFENANPITPAPPINRYLHPSDIAIFSTLHKQRFLSSPWKGLALGITTENYPLHTKSATLSREAIQYGTFMNSNCSTKTQLTQKFKIDYVYSPPFECAGFEAQEKNAEGVVLYKVL